MDNRPQRIALGTQSRRNLLTLPWSLSHYAYKSAQPVWDQTKQQGICPEKVVFYRQYARGDISVLI